MEFDSTLKKYAKALIDLTPKIHSTQYSIVPIGNGGAIAYHCLLDRMKKRSVFREDDLKNSFYASSKDGYLDSLKLSQVILNQSVLKGNHLYFLDERTKTGRLFEMLEPCIRNLEKGIGKITYDFVALFDPNGKATIRGSSEDLTDDERNQMKFFDDFSKAPITGEFAIIRPDYTIWKYDNLSHDTIAKLRHIPKIKNLL